MNTHASNTNARLYPLLFDQLGNKNTGKTASPSTAMHNAQKTAQENNESQPQSLNTSRITTSTYSSVSNRFSFDLTTQEGDRVTIDMHSSIAQQTSLERMNDDDSVSFSAIASRYSQSGFNYSVAGDLSEDELASIDAFIEQVAKVASDFYQGDVQQAFQSAKQLQYNSEQIASFAIDMQQVSTVVVSAQANAYETEKGPGIKLADMVNALVNQAQTVIDQYFKGAVAFDVFEEIAQHDQRHEQHEHQPMLDLLRDSVSLLESPPSITEKEKEEA